MPIGNPIRQPPAYINKHCFLVITKSTTDMHAHIVNSNFATTTPPALNAVGSCYLFILIWTMKKKYGIAFQDRRHKQDPHITIHPFLPHFGIMHVLLSYPFPFSHTDFHNPFLSWLQSSKFSPHILSLSPCVLFQPFPIAFLLLLFFNFNFLRSRFNFTILYSIRKKMSTA